jgi:hypothetical protein
MEQFTQSRTFFYQWISRIVTTGFFRDIFLEESVRFTFGLICREL